MADRGKLEGMKLQSLKDFIATRPSSACQVCRFLKAHPEVAAQVAELQSEGQSITTTDVHDYVKRVYGVLLSSSSIYHHFKREHK